MNTSTNRFRAFSRLQFSRRQFSRRRGLLGLAVGALCLLSASAPPAGGLKVVTTIPDLADIVGRIGGSRVDVQALSRGTENLHAVAVRPSMLIALSRADLFFEMGLSMESAWVPELLLAARNDDIAVGSTGFVNCGVDWEPIQVPTVLSRKQGDIHPQGNPHYNIDPRAGRYLADKVLAGLIAADPEGRAEYERRHAEYVEQLDAAEKRWKQLGAAWKGRKIAVYHLEYNYLAQYHGMDVAVSIEPQPGIPPSPGDIARAVREIRDEGVELIVTASWSNNRDVRAVAKKSGVPVLELPNQVGGADWGKTWIDMMDGIHARLAQALGTEAE